MENLRRYLQLSAASVSSKLFVHPSTLGELSVNKLRLLLCKFIRKADPTSFPKSHDLRKMASSFAFFHNIDMQEICDLVGWSSIRVFRKHYLKQIQEVSSSVVVLGAELPASVKESNP